MANELYRIDLADGKYTVIEYEDHSFVARRYGDPWRNLTGDKLVWYMAQEILELRKQLEEKR